MDIVFIEVVLFVLIILNVAVSIFLIRRHDLDRIQKFLQIVIVWLFPYVGAIGLWLFNRCHDVKGSPNPPAFGGGANDSSTIVCGAEGGSGGGD
jgi:hypothetical protein